MPAGTACGDWPAVEGVRDWQGLREGAGRALAVARLADNGAGNGRGWPAGNGAGNCHGAGGTIKRGGQNVRTCYKPIGGLWQGALDRLAGRARLLLREGRDEKMRNEQAGQGGREAQEVEARARAQELEAVPAGQLSFKRKGWGVRALAGKVEAVAVLAVPLNKKLFYELVAVAGRHLPADKIHVDETCNAELWHSSRVRWSVELKRAIAVEVYYHNEAVRLPVLAHEVGHLETLPKLGAIEFYCSSDSNRYHAEVEASRWAVAFLKSKGLGGEAYAEAVNLLQGCLDNYKRDLCVPVRYVLDYDIENKNKKGGL